MSPASLPENPSPNSSVPPTVIQGVKHEIPDSQQTSPGVSPGPVRRPSFEKLDSAEVAKAMGVAAALKKMKPYSPPAKQKKKEVAKPPPPKPAVYIPRPPPKPFSGNSNPDAIALRSSASLLQMQAAKARQDLETLERLKVLANDDPLAFTQELVTGRVKQEPSSGGILGPTLAPLESLLKDVDSEDVKGAEEEAMKEIPDTQESEDNDVTSAATSFGPPSNATSKFPSIPGPQNIIRMPPINWSKYGVVGDSLDKMHEEQRTNPTPSQPEILATRDSQPPRPIMEQYQHSSAEKAAPYVVAAPYDPLKDQPKADSRRGTDTRKQNKRSRGSRKRSPIKRSMAGRKSNVKWTGKLSIPDSAIKPLDMSDVTLHPESPETNATAVEDTVLQPSLDPTPSNEHEHEPQLAGDPKRSMARPKLRKKEAPVQDAGSTIILPSIQDDEAYSPHKRRKGFDELRGTEVAYSLYGELGIYLPNLEASERKVEMKEEASNKKSCFFTPTSPNSLKRYYDSVRQPAAQQSPTKVLPDSPFPNNIRVVTPTPPCSPGKAIVEPGGH